MIHHHLTNIKKTKTFNAGNFANHIAKVILAVGFTTILLAWSGGDSDQVTISTIQTPTITVPTSKPQNIKVYISSTNTLPTGCNFTYEACWKVSVENGTVLIVNGGSQNYAYYKAGSYYIIRAIGSDGILIHGSHAVDAFGVSSLQDWVLGTSTGIIKHQAVDNTCWNAANDQVVCPV